MKMNASMNWIDRYLYAVTRRLPKAMREDLEKELRSNLMDALEERLDGREATQQDILELLNDFGDPRKVASEYMPEQKYLIGPEFIDLYWMILKIASIGVAIGLTVVLILSILQGDASQGSLIQVIARYIGTLWSAGISLVGTVTLIFALIQHSTAGERFGSSEAAEELRQAGKEIQDAFDKSAASAPTKRSQASKTSTPWSAEQLPAVPASTDRVSLPECVISLVFIGLALLIFNVYPDKLGAYFYDAAAARWVGVPFFNVAILSAYVMVYNVIWFMDALLQVRLIQKGRWGFAERAAKIVISLLGLGVFIALIQNPAVFNLEGIRQSLAQYSVDLSALSKVGFFNLRFLMIIVIIATLAEVIKQAVLALKSRLN